MAHGKTHQFQVDALMGLTSAESLAQLAPVPEGPLVRQPALDFHRKVQIHLEKLRSWKCWPGACGRSGKGYDRHWQLKDRIIDSKVKDSKSDG
jgi:hypothetical protein